MVGTILVHHRQPFHAFGARAGFRHIDDAAVEIAGLAGQPITLTWTPDTAAIPANVVREVQAGTAGELTWPGTGFDPSGISIDWPGWRPLVESDYNADGTLKPETRQRLGL